MKTRLAILAFLFAVATGKIAWSFLIQTPLYVEGEKWVYVVREGETEEAAKKTAGEKITILFKNGAFKVDNKSAFSMPSVPTVFTGDPEREFFRFDLKPDMKWKFKFLHVSRQGRGKRFWREVSLTASKNLSTKEVNGKMYEVIEIAREDIGGEASADGSYFYSADVKGSVYSVAKIYGPRQSIPTEVVVTELESHTTPTPVPVTDGVK